MPMPPLSARQQLLLNDFPHKRTMSTRAACAVALKRHLESLRFTGLELNRFQHVFDAWPDFEDRHEPPSCCILPAGGSTGEQLSPSAVEDTWTGPDEPDGFVLWKVGEYSVSFDVIYRGIDAIQRQLIEAELEDAFISDDVGHPNRGGNVYGIMLDTPEYYGRTARFTMVSTRIDDAMASAARNERTGTIAVDAQIEHLVVRPARRFNARAEIGDFTGV